MTGVLSAPGPRRILGRDCSDHELVARVREGDDRAFELLFERYRTRITNFIRGMVQDHARAEDIAQDVFMSALRRMRETDRSIAFRPWIYEIARNACIDAHRRARRAQEVSYDETLGGTDRSRLVSPRAVSDAVETRQSLENLQGALGALSESHADILVLRELEGLSYQEIGERLGMSRASVESTLFRARKKLESEYNDLVSGERCRQVQVTLETLQGGRARLRDRRHMARHLAWCQSCRHQARLAGLEVEVAARVPLRKKVGALLPIPAFIRERLMRGVVPGPWAGAGDPLMEWGRAAVAVAVVAVAGIGAGSVVGGGPIVDAYGYSPVPKLFQGGGEDASPPLLRDIASLVGTEPTLPAVGQVPAGPAGTGVLGAPVSAGPLVGGGGVPAAGGGVQQGAAGATGGVGGAVQASAGAAGGAAGGAGGAVGGAVNGLGGTVGGAVNGLGGTVGGAVGGLGGTTGGAVQGATQTAGGTVRGVTQTTGNAVNGLTQTAGGLVRDVTQNPTNLGAAVNNAVTGTTQTVSRTVQGTTQTLNQTVRGTTQTVNQTVRGTTQTVTQAGRNTTQTATDTVRGVTGTTTTAVQGVVGGVSRATQPPAPATTTSAPAPAQTTAAPAPQTTTSSTPVQDVVQQTTDTVGSILGG